MILGFASDSISSLHQNSLDLLWSVIVIEPQCILQTRA